MLRKNHLFLSLLAAVIVLAATGCTITPEDLVTVTDDGTDSPAVELTVNGPPLETSTGSGSYAQFFFLASAGTEYTVTVRPFSGDPDLYVCSAAGCDSLGSDVGSSGGFDTEDVSFTSGGAAATYYIGVFGFTGDAVFDIQVTSTVTLTVDGGALADTVGRELVRQYAFAATTGTGYSVTLAPVSGNPDLTVCRSGPCDDASSDQIGASANTTGNDAVTFTATSTGTVYVGVRGVNGDAPFTIQVSSGTTLTVDAPTLAGSAASGAYARFLFTASAAREYTVTVVPVSGNPDLYVCSSSPCESGSTPSLGTSVKASGTDAVTFTAASAGTVSIGVFATGGAASFTIQVATPKELTFSVSATAVNFRVKIYNQTSHVIDSPLLPTTSNWKWPHYGVATTYTFLIFLDVNGDSLFTVAGGDKGHFAATTGDFNSYTLNNAEVATLMAAPISVTGAPAGITDGTPLVCMWHTGTGSNPLTDPAVTVGVSKSGTNKFSGGAVTTDLNDAMIRDVSSYLTNYRVTCVADQVATNVFNPAAPVLDTGDWVATKTGIAFTGATTPITGFVQQ